MAQPQPAELQIADALTQDELDELTKCLGDWATECYAWRERSYGATRRLHEEYCQWADRNAQPLICDLATFERLLTSQGFDVQAGFVHGLLLREDAHPDGRPPSNTPVEVAPLATRWLAAFLRRGPRSFIECDRMGRGVGYSRASLIRAAEYLRVDKVSHGGATCWKLDPHYQYLAAQT